MTAGSMIAAARQAQGMSVDDLAHAVRLRATIVMAMEADDFEACGGAVYARGHLRAMAGILDLNPDVLVTAFDRAQGSTADD